MCGLVGIAGRLGVKEDHIIDQLLIVDSLRGQHSTGIAVVPNTDTSIRIAKQVGSPFELMGMKSYTAALAGFNRAIMGHNRFATTGAVTKKNAHPFAFDTIVGMHNGTLKNKQRLMDSHLFEVDSENLFYHIEQKGLKDAIKNLSGAWALVWYDTADDTLNFLRNTERPLYYAQSFDKSKVYWASEDWMLKGVLERNEVVHNGITLFETDIHYKVSFSDSGVIAEVVKNRVASEYVPPVMTHGRGHYTYNGVVHQIGKDKVDAKQPEKKKQQVATGNTGATYRNTKQASLIVVSEVVDKNGGHYLECSDLNVDGVEVRIYSSNIFNPSDYSDGDNITADIKSEVIDSVEGTYYKADQFSVKRSTDLLLDHNGKEISNENFTKKYQCGNCDGAVSGWLPHKFTKSGMALCHLCCNDQQVLSLVSVC